MFQIEMYGDIGLRIQFGEVISKATNEEIRCFCILLEQEKITGVIEWIPTYTAVTIIYNPFEILYNELKNKMESILEQISSTELPPADIVQIPVLYGGDKGPDLDEVANRNGLNVSDVVSLHTGTDYLIYMMGFIPGFAYLGGMSEKIATPRKKTPRSAIPAGSVGIAGEQTGIYPLQSPGGWQIIGQTPVRLYDGNKETPILLKAGNYIRFVPITKQEFDEIEKAVESGSYTPHVEKYKE